MRSRAPEHRPANLTAQVGQYGQHAAVVIRSGQQLQLGEDAGDVSLNRLGNLDSQRAQEVLALLRKLNREHGQTFVLVTHDSEVGAACDRVILMRDGKVLG
jgi:ABC-type enterochelin transport system ATPase subunit